MEYNDLPACACGNRFTRKLSAPAIQTDIEPFRSPKTGQIINSRAALREDLARSGCFLNETGVDRDVKRWGTEAKEKAFAPIAAGVDQAVSQLVATQQIEG